MNKKIVCLRDDDLNFFSNFLKIQEDFDGVLGELPITFATVPFIHGSVPKIIEEPRLYNDIVKNKYVDTGMSEYMKIHKTYPVGENKELVSLIKSFLKLNKLEIAQHGVTHRYDYTGAEMQSKEIGKRYIYEGKEYLERLFETSVKVFIPPSNYIDNKCVDYLNELDMDLLCCGSIRFESGFEKMKKGLSHPIDMVKIIGGRIKKEAPPIKTTGGYNIVNSITLNLKDEYGMFEKKVQMSLEKYGAASITSHYWYFEGVLGKEYKRKYQLLVNNLRKQYDIEFLKASEYIERLKNV